MTGFILSVGDELVSGLTVDTNSAWLSLRLAEAGIRVIGHATVGDDQPAIEASIASTAARAALLVITGGIGPTPDDLTREALAAVLGEPLVEDQTWTRHMEAYFAERGREMQRGNLKQALIPHGARLLWNRVGTAAGIDATILATDREEQARKASCKVVVLPGVPGEMRAMFEEHVFPWVQKHWEEHGGTVVRVRALHTFGLGESDIAARLGNLLRRRDEADGLQVGTTAASGVVSIRAYASAPDESAALVMLDDVEREARETLGDVIFGRDRESLPTVAGRLLRQAPGKPLLRVAESCTGGLLAKLITDIAGSSEYFDRGFVTYTNQAKTQLLGVPAALIETQGAVSEPVAAAMAQGALPKEGSAIALSISGIAGPGGGTEEKPVGTVCIGLAANTDRGPATVGSRRFRFVGDREMIRLRSALMALSMLRYYLLDRKMPF